MAALPSKEVKVIVKYHLAHTRQWLKFIHLFLQCWGMNPGPCIAMYSTIKCSYGPKICNLLSFFFFFFAGVGFELRASSLLGRLILESLPQALFLL
jgi:hypothetical protein